MLKKTIKYVDFNGTEREEDFYFNLSKAELTEMQMEMPGGFDAYIKKIVNSKDQFSLIQIFKEIILRSYGKKSEDGRVFKKSKEMSEEFAQSAAYEVLFMELSTNDVAASNFIKAIVPADLSSKLAELPEGPAAN